MKILFQGGLIFLLLFFITEQVYADSWWGHGYRKPEWVLEHGGTIIKYEVEGKESTDRYKARLYKGNHVIETEDNGKGKFDDAKDGKYSVLIFKGKDVKSRTTVVAHPGETIELEFDLDDDEVEKTSHIIDEFKKKPVPVKKVAPEKKALPTVATNSLQKKADKEENDNKKEKDVNLDINNESKKSEGVQKEKKEENSELKVNKEEKERENKENLKKERILMEDSQKKIIKFHQYFSNKFHALLKLLNPFSQL